MHLDEPILEFMQSHPDYLIGYNAATLYILRTCHTIFENMSPNAEAFAQFVLDGTNKLYEVSNEFIDYSLIVSKNVAFLDFLYDVVDEFEKTFDFGITSSIIHEAKHLFLEYVNPTYFTQYDIFLIDKTGEMLIKNILKEN